MQIRRMGRLYVMLGGGVSTISREIVVAVEKWGHFEHLGRMLRSVGWTVGQSTFGVEFGARRRWEVVCPTRDHGRSI